MGHRASDCFSKVQERNPRRYCFRCGGIGHNFMQCEKGNLLANGGAGERERMYKVACPMPIEKLNPAENGRRKKENYRSLSKEGKEVGLELQ